MWRNDHRQREEVCGRPQAVTWMYRRILWPVLSIRSRGLTCTFKDKCVHVLEPLHRWEVRGQPWSWTSLSVFLWALGFRCQAPPVGFVGRPRPLKLVC